MKKILCSVIVFALLFSAFSANAVPAPDMACGDVDKSGWVTVQDATLIQKYTAGLEEFSKIQLFVGDVNEDSEVNVKDATLTQKVVAGLTNFKASKFVYEHIDIATFVSSYDNGKAVPGVPVTFYANAFSMNRAPETMYEFSVDGEIVQSSKEAEFTYTFDSVGEYEISLKVWDRFDNTNTFTTTYMVSEDTSTDDELQITGFYHNAYPDEYISAVSGLYYTAHATKGSGKYEYRFLIDGVPVQDFSGNNTYYVDGKSNNDNYYTSDVITVQVRDKEAPDFYVSADLPTFDTIMVI